MTDPIDNFHVCGTTDTIDLVFSQSRYYLTTIHHPDGRVAEVIYSGPRNGSILALIAQDACLLITELLRRYVSPHSLCEVIERCDNGEALSIIGQIILHLAEQQP